MVRHGQTASNVAKRMMGNRIDDPLNDEGRRQAQELAENIKDMQFDVIFSSPLKRAHQTAEIIAKNWNMPIMQRDELMERDFGTLTGKTFAEGDALTGGRRSRVEPLPEDEEYERAWGRETSEKFQKRLRHFTDEIKEKYSDKKVLVVAHSGVIKMAHFLFKDSTVDHVKNASIEEFEI